MARTWIVNQSDCSKINLNHDSDDDNAIWVENTWHEVSPNHIATLPSGTKMLDDNQKELTLVDGYCTTYFYKGWQTVSTLNNYALGVIIKKKNNFDHSILSDRVGQEVGGRYLDQLGNIYLQVVRLRDEHLTVINLPDNMGKNLIPDLYPGRRWRSEDNNKNWYDQWYITPLVSSNGEITSQTSTFPRTFKIDETRLPGYGKDTNKSFYAPELFAPYMYLLGRSEARNDAYIGGLIVVIGVKKLS